MFLGWIRACDQDLLGCASVGALGCKDVCLGETARVQLPWVLTGRADPVDGPLPCSDPLEPASLECRTLSFWTCRAEGVRHPCGGIFLSGHYSDRGQER